jgi:hypothetical protein
MIYVFLLSILYVFVKPIATYQAVILSIIGLSFLEGYLITMEINLVREKDSILPSMDIVMSNTVKVMILMALIVPIIFGVYYITAYIFYSFEFSSPDTARFILHLIFAFVSWIILRASSQSFYILCDKELGVIQSISESIKMIKGYHGKLFYLNFLHILLLICSIKMNLLFVWTLPRIRIERALMYLIILRNEEENQYIYYHPYTYKEMGYINDDKTDDLNDIGNNRINTSNNALYDATDTSDNSNNVLDNFNDDDIITDYDYLDDYNEVHKINS